MKLLGWRVAGESVKIPLKAVLVMIPHTSNWDFIYGSLGLSSLGAKNVKFLIKREAFFFPFGFLLKAMGGLPVDRSKSVPVVVQVRKMFQQHEKMLLVVTPEGTRKLSKNWKRGFYSIAIDAGVPIVLSYLDYKNKVGGAGLVIENPGSYEEVLEIMQTFYRGRHARFPENFSLSPMYLTN